MQNEILNALGFNIFVDLLKATQRYYTIKIFYITKENTHINITYIFNDQVNTMRLNAKDGPPRDQVKKLISKKYNIQIEKLWRIQFSEI